MCMGGVTHHSEWFLKSQNAWTCAVLREDTSCGAIKGHAFFSFSLEEGTDLAFQDKDQEICSFQRIQHRTMIHVII
jgi:hypothetical protein